MAFEIPLGQRLTNTAARRWGGVRNDGVIEQNHQTKDFGPRASSIAAGADCSGFSEAFAGMLFAALPLPAVRQAVAHAEKSVPLPGGVRGGLSRFRFMGTRSEWGQL